MLKGCILKKYIAMALVVLTLGLSVSPVYSSDNIEKKVQVNILNRAFVITLKAQPETKVCLEILYPGSDIPAADSSSEALLNAFAYIGQKTTDANGEAVFRYVPDRLKGEYTFRASPNVENVFIRLEVDEEPFFVLTWPYGTEFSQDNVYDSASLWKYRLDNPGAKIEAQNIKKKLDISPEGKRSLLVVNDFENYLVKEPDNYIWYDAKVEKIKGYIDEFFKELKAIDGKLDYVLLDMELEEMSVYRLGDSPEVYKSIAEDSRYLTEIRPLLEERGFEFSSNEQYGELYSVNEGSNSYIWDTVMLNRIAAYWEEALYLPITKYYPDVKCSNYGYIDGKGWDKVPNNVGSRVYLGGNTDKIGTHSCVSMYGALGWIAQSSNTRPEDYYGYMYENTPFHSLMFDNNKLKKAWIGDKDKQIQAWVCPYNANYGYANSGYGNTPYYAENIFHIGLLDPEPFLFYGLTTDAVDGKIIDDAEKEKRMDILSSLLDELDEVVGFADRRPLTKGLNSWNDHYILSGMYAAGNNIWRITPDLTVSGITLESFCTNEETPTFYIDGKTITFPQGYIYNPITENENTCGYWVITPENAEPVVSYDAKSSSDKIDANMEIYAADTGVVTEKIPEGNIAARVSYKNFTTENEKVFLFMTAYEGNKLVDAKVLAEAPAYSGMDNVITVADIPKPADATRLSFFLLGDDLKPFVPLSTLGSN